VINKLLQDRTRVEDADELADAERDRAARAHVDGLPRGGPTLGDTDAEREEGYAAWTEVAAAIARSSR
jgi:hypothetical protein